MLLLTGAFLSIGLITNFLSLKEIFLISLQGNPIFGVSLQKCKAEGKLRTPPPKNHSQFLIYNNRAQTSPKPTLIFQYSYAEWNQQTKLVMQMN